MTVVTIEDEIREDQTAEQTEAEEAAAEEAEAETAEAEAEADAEEGSGTEAEKEAETEAPAAEEKQDPFESKYIRLMAEFQNYKKRTQKEKDEIYKYGAEKLMVKLLDVVDNFDRALDAPTTDTKYAEGLELIFKSLTDVLAASGLEEIDALGKEFDPNFHNAVMTEDNPDYESGQVSGVLQKGYTLNGKVIRPSMVKVNN